MLRLSLPMGLPRRNALRVPRVTRWGAISVALKLASQLCTVTPKRQGHNPDVVFNDIKERSPEEGPAVDLLDAAVYSAGKRRGRAGEADAVAVNSKTFAPALRAWPRHGVCQYCQRHGCDNRGVRAPDRIKRQPIYGVHLRDAITGITVDAAVDEAETRKTPALTREMRALAPNLRRVIRDKAQRPFAADFFLLLHDVLNMVASGRGSMARSLRRAGCSWAMRGARCQAMRFGSRSRGPPSTAEAVGQGLYSYAFHDQDGCPHSRVWHPRWEIPREAVASMAGH